MEKYKEEGIDYLKKFFDGHYSKYVENMQEYSSPDYYFDYGRDQVKQGFLDVVLCVENYFSDMRIPECYASFEHFAKTFTNYKHLLNKKVEICKELIKHYKNKKEEIPTPISILYSMANEILDAMRVAQEEFFDANQKTKDNDNIAVLKQILNKFGSVARGITPAQRRRNNGTPRSTMEINDEYDVQDLLYAILKIFFDDVRKEENSPSFAALKTRTDLYLYNEKIFIEVKKTNKNLKDKKIAEQLIIDGACYKTHLGCQTLIGFIYDPDNYLQNAASLQDLKNNNFDHIIVSH